VAPTQAAFTPDGAQYRCGAHAIRHALPLAAGAGLRGRIVASLPGLEALPDPAACDGCALATLYINQEVERRLRDDVRVLLHGSAPQPPSAPHSTDLNGTLDEI